MKISLQLPAGPEGAGHARRALDGLRRETPTETVSTLELLVSEIVAHSPRHPDEHTTDWVLLDVQTSPQTIHAEIADLGTGLPTVPPSEDRETTGWSIALIAEFSSRWGILEGPRDGLWLEVDRWTRKSLGHPV